MKGLLKFFEKILRNEGKLYERENLMIFGIKESLFVTLFSIFMLAFPRCRAILKWITYIGVFIAGMSACGVLFDNIYALYDSYKYDKNLEESGSSREEVVFGDSKSPEIKES
jgi:hypothetical protein